MAISILSLQSSSELCVLLLVALWKDKSVKSIVQEGSDTVLSMCVQVFCRDFSWSALMLWPEDMPPDTVICISGADNLVPTKLILRHLRTAGSSAKARMLP